MRKLLMLLILFRSFGAESQEKGIHFESKLSWAEIKTKAKTENKYIFVDAFATWCAPCKRMDNEVYSNSALGTLTNRDFISVKVQMDQNGNDDAKVKQWYNDATALQQKYSIVAFPTYLFFSPNGEISHMTGGYKDVGEFTKLIHQVLDPRNSFQNLIRQFNTGELPVEKMLSLSLLAKKYKEDNVAMKIAEKFKKDFLNKMSPKNILSKDLPPFLNAFNGLFNFNDEVIKYIYKESVDADRIFEWKGFSKKYTDFIISRDYIYAQIRPNGVWSTTAPDWRSLQKRISSSFDSKTATRLILKSKVSYFSQKSDWNNLIKYSIKNIDFNGIDTTVMGLVGLNNMVYELIFKHSSSSKQLKKGISYMQRILELYPEDQASLDTYAGVLYKAGFKAKALIYQKKAYDLAVKSNQQDNILVFDENLKKMEKNIPTWTSN